MGVSCVFSRRPTRTDTQCCGTKTADAGFLVETTMKSVLPLGLLDLPARHPDGGFTVVIETPRGSPAKFKFEPERGVFTLSHLLTEGTVYPHDWGYIPATLGPDGDPMDALLLGAAGTFAGLVVRARAIGVLEVAQREKGRKFRNDRLLF